MTDTRERIRALNDDLRRLHRGGQVLLTSGIQALDERTIRHIDVAIAKFDAFDEDNDPHGEHDFGSVSVGGETVFFKIDYYDVTRTSHSPDLADPSVTERVMTVMLAEEY